MTFVQKRRLKGFEVGDLEEELEKSSFQGGKLELFSNRSQFLATAITLSRLQSEQLCSSVRLDWLWRTELGGVKCSSGQAGDHWEDHRSKPEVITSPPFFFSFSSCSVSGCLNSHDNVKMTQQRQKHKSPAGCLDTSAWEVRQLLQSAILRALCFDGSVFVGVCWFEVFFLGEENAYLSSLPPLKKRESEVGISEPTTKRGVEVSTTLRKSVSLSYRRLSFRCVALQKSLLFFVILHLHSDCCWYCLVSPPPWGEGGRIPKKKKKKTSGLHTQAQMLRRLFVGYDRACCYFLSVLYLLIELHWGLLWVL